MVRMQVPGVHILAVDDCRIVEDRCIGVSVRLSSSRPATDKC